MRWQSTNCLLDTGAEVSTLTEGFFWNYMLLLGHKLNDITGLVPMVVCVLSWQCELVVIGDALKFFFLPEIQ